MTDAALILSLALGVFGNSFEGPPPRPPLETGYYQSCWYTYPDELPVIEDRATFCNVLSRGGQLRADLARVRDAGLRAIIDTHIYVNRPVARRELLNVVPDFRDTIFAFSSVDEPRLHATTYSAEAIQAWHDWLKEHFPEIPIHCNYAVRLRGIQWPDPVPATGCDIVSYTPEYGNPNILWDAYQHAKASRYLWVVDGWGGWDGRRGNCGRADLCERMRQIKYQLMRTLCYADANCLGYFVFIWHDLNTGAGVNRMEAFRQSLRTP